MLRNICALHLYHPRFQPLPLFILVSVQHYLLLPLFYGWWVLAMCCYFLTWPSTGVVGDCETSAGHASHSKQQNRPWGYKPGSKNLFEAMAARTDEALRAAPEGSRLGGMLWYQVGLRGILKCRFAIVLDCMVFCSHPHLFRRTTGMLQSWDFRPPFAPSVKCVIGRLGSRQVLCAFVVRLKMEALALPIIASLLAF